MNTQTVLGIFAAGSMAAVASADYTINFDEFVAAGGNFTRVSEEATLTGTLTSALGDFVLNTEGENFTWCDDLCVIIANDNLSELLVQIGGFSDFGASYRYTWPEGGAGDAGTEGGGEVITDAIDATGYYVWLGNGYGSGGNGDWSGSIVLGGVVPAPGAVALLGLGGLVARRRRA